LERENTNLKRKLTEAIHHIRAQSEELTGLRKTLDTFEAQHSQFNCHGSSQEAEILNISENFYVNELDLKNKEYEINFFEERT
jgi:hypothetical protein